MFESPHFSILYPFYFFGLLNYGGPLASLYTLTYLTLVHLFVFYINLYVLLRCAAITPWASYIGASVGMLAWNTELYASWITITASYAWLPLVLAGGVLLLRSPGKACGILVFSIAAGLLALASPSQPVIHTALSCLMLFATAIAWLCLQRRFADLQALSLVSRDMCRHRIRTRRGRDSPNVPRHRRNDPRTSAAGAGCRSGTPVFRGNISIWHQLSPEPGHRHRDQANVDSHHRQSLRRSAWCHRNAPDS